MTDSAGCFRMDSIDPGVYVVEVNDGVAAACLVECELIDSTQAVDLGELKVGPYARLHGTIGISGIGSPDSTVPLYVQIYGLERIAEVDNEGTFEFSDLPEAMYRIRVVSPETDFTPLDVDSVTAVSDSTRELGSFFPWAHSARLEINTSSSGVVMDHDVINFPLLVRLDDLNFDFSQVKGAGEDLRFAKPGGTPLPYEIEQWDVEARTAAVWVRIDTVYAGNDSQYVSMHWGNPNAFSLSNAAAVFDTADGFVGAWHFSDPAGSEKLRDATLYANDVTCLAALADSNAVVGCIGGGFHSSGNYQGYIIEDNPSLRLNSMTISTWAYFNRPISQMQANYHSLMTKEDDTTYSGYTLGMFNSRKDSIGIRITNDIGSAPFASVEEKTSREWVLWTGTFDGVMVRLYCNGTLAAQAPAVSPFQLNNETELSFGSFFEGIMDEARLCNRARTAMWIKLSYENQKVGSTLVSIR
jgi:hypothetical protein